MGNGFDSFQNSETSSTVFVFFSRWIVHTYGIATYHVSFRLHRCLDYQDVSYQSDTNSSNSKGLHPPPPTHTHTRPSLCVTINNWELAKVRNRCHVLIHSLACLINKKYHGFSKYSALKTQILWQTSKSSSRRQKTHSFGRQTISNNQLWNLWNKAAAMPYILYIATWDTALLGLWYCVSVLSEHYTQL